MTVASQENERFAADLAALEAEIKVNLASPSNESDVFLDRALNRLRAVPLAIEPKRRINCLIDIGSSYYHEGQNSERGIEPAALAVALAREVDDPALLRKALNVWAVLLYSTNSPVEAVRALSEALALAEASGEEMGKFAVWTNLGCAFYMAGLYLDAKSCSETAWRLVQDPQLNHLKGTARANAALCCLHLQDFEAGLEHIREAIAHETVSGTAAELLNRVFTEGTYTRLLLSLERVAEASDRAVLAREFAVAAKSIRADISASCAAGLVEVYSGKVDAGLARLTDTMAKARSIKPALRETLLVLVQANERAGKPDAALRLFRELTVDLRQTQSDALDRQRTNPEKELGFVSAERAAVLDTARKRIFACLTSTH